MADFLDNNTLERDLSLLSFDELEYRYSTARQHRHDPSAAAELDALRAALRRFFEELWPSREHAS